MAPTKDEIKQKMQKTLEALGEDLKTIRTGRANPEMVSEIMVEAYGSKSPIKQNASINIPDAKVIVIQPWDKALLTEIKKGIELANVGFTPVIDSDIVRINIPSLTEETRKEYVKMMKTKLEETRISLRQIRHDAVQQYDHAKAAKEVTEDDVKSWKESMDEMIGEMNKEVEAAGHKKEEEIMTV